MHTGIIKITCTGPFYVDFMTTILYTQKITYTDNKIILETFANSSHLIDFVTRGTTENQLLAAIFISHKQQADVLLGTSSPQQLEIRQAYDSKRDALSGVTAALP